MKSLLLSLFFMTALTSGKMLYAESIAYGYNPAAGDYLELENNTRLYYEIYGEGEPLLLLHGGVFGYIDEFEHLIPKLAKKYRVICLATRGHVKSNVGKLPYTYEQYAMDAYKLITYLKLERVTVVGFSDGGYTAYKLAAIYPEKITKIVAMGAGDLPVKQTPGNSNLSVEGLLAEYEEFFKKRLASMPQPKRWSESLAMMNTMYNTSFLSNETFHKIAQPVLVISGDRDEYFSLESMLSVHKNLVDSRLAVIPECGHVILYCNFPAVWASLGPFLGFTTES